MISVEITKPLGITMFDNAFPRNDFETKEPEEECRRRSHVEREPHSPST